MSYNNYFDVDVVYGCVCDYLMSDLTCVIVKYINSCGIASASGVNGDLFEVYCMVVCVDLIFVFGGIVVFNCMVDVDMVWEICEFCFFIDDETRMFYEIVIVSFYIFEGLEVLKGKFKMLCILEIKLCMGLMKSLW